MQTSAAPSPEVSLAGPRAGCLSIKLGGHESAQMSLCATRLADSRPPPAIVCCSLVSLAKPNSPESQIPAAASSEQQQQQPAALACSCLQSAGVFGRQLSQHAQQVDSAHLDWPDIEQQPARIRLFGRRSISEKCVLSCERWLVWLWQSQNKSQNKLACQPKEAQTETNNVATRHVSVSELTASQPKEAGWLARQASY